jgi:branched-chain amino acid transport system permease protein
MTTSWLLNLAVLGLMYAVLASSWNLLAGYTGYISLAHAAFFGIGAYSLALWTGPNTTSLGGYGPLLLTIPIGLAVGVAALPIGWVILRTRHVTFAIVSITLLFMVQTLAFNLTGLTGGSQGLAVAAPPFPASWFERPFYWAMLVLLAVCVVIFETVRRSRLGLSLTALREDEEKARGLGVPTQPLKIGAFAVSVAITAMAGGVWAYYLTFIEPQYAIDPLLMVGTALTAFLGGKGTLWGPTIGALIVVPAQQYFAFRLGASDLYLVSYAAIFLVVILVLPRGVVPSLGEWIRGRQARASAASATAPDPQQPAPAGAAR